MARKRSQPKKEPHIVENEMDDSDDEEIDEDEAFNSEDELKYGSFFVGKSKKSKPQVKKIGQDSDDEGDANGSSSEEEDSYSDDDDHSKDWAGESDSDGEEDDGGQYMLDLLNNLDKQVPGKDASSSKASEKKRSESYNGKIQLDHVPAAAVHMPESEFGAAIVSVPSAANNFGAGNKLTLDSLMGGISDTQGFTQVQRTMRALSSGNGASMDDETKKLETTPAPVPRVVSERASRKVHYQATTDDVSRWKDIIHIQRDAETLDFRVNKGGAKASCVTKDGLIAKFEAKTEFEEELARALEIAGMEDEKEMQKRERKRLLDNGGSADGFEDGELNEGGVDDDLGTNKISLEEYKKRHGELAKMRALMFYEEQKRHRINKIKSKKYRKIQKRKREREKEAEEESAGLHDPNVDREKLEREEMERMKERMTLAHKNTSKWARRVLRRGAKMDPDERRALSLQIAKGDALRRKVMGDDSGEDASNDEAETEEDLIKRARDLLVEGGDVTVDSLGKKKGLFELEFMKRGMEAQRARAKEEARRLLEELEANEVASADSDDESNGDIGERKKPVKPKVASEEETSKVLAEGKLVASSLEFGKSDAFTVTAAGNIGFNGIDAAGKGERSSVEEHSKMPKPKKKKKKKTEIDELNAEESDLPKSADVQSQDEANPWMTGTKGTSPSPENKSSKPQKNSATKGKPSSSLKVNINAAASMLVDDSQREKNNISDGNEVEGTVAETDHPPKSSDTGLASLSQAELVRRAFASPDDLEAEEEFQQEKERMKERDDPTRQVKEEKAVSGWGSWAGAGAPPPRKPRKLPKHLSAPLKKPEKPTKRKDDGLNTVIINEKRLKKTAQFQLAEIPYPYRSRQEYEKAIAGNIGHEWNTANGVKEMTRPSVIVRSGKVIKPLPKKAKSKRAPAKF
eukprot:CCRYP_019419-RB/>CCRYP_019419-RB protein AED:0.18 eAED:0.18 QI:302/1/1/1/1/1/4/165/917